MTRLLASCRDVCKQCTWFGRMQRFNLTTMVKCMVQTCRNHSEEEPSNRPRKRFFGFPNDKARVKVWLAALRESEREIPEHIRICEDHFLNHHITANGISPDAIPIMPPLDGLLLDSTTADEVKMSPSKQKQYCLNMSTDIAR